MRGALVTYADMCSQCGTMEIRDGEFVHKLLSCIERPSLRPRGPVTHRCRACGDKLGDPFLDLGFSPLANDYRRTVGGQMFYPLQLRVCESCWLVQLPNTCHPPEIFGDDYAYQTSVIPGAVRHAGVFAAQMIDRLDLGAHTRVIEVASNDGYLLEQFARHGIPTTGVEPARRLVDFALAERGVYSIPGFFGRDFAASMPPKKADLLIANNVLAHVPDLNDFVAGLKLALAPTGTLTVEVPWLLKLIEGVQFDTIYHEHFSYFSLNTLARLFSKHSLLIYDVEELPTHGGSLRLFIGHAPLSEQPPRWVMSQAVAVLAEHEIEAGLLKRETYEEFGVHALGEAYLFRERMSTGHGKRAIFGCPAKLTTRLHASGADREDFGYAVDDTPAKQGRYVPGTSIPIYPVEHLKTDPPDVLVNVVWNWKEDVERRLKEIGYTGRVIHVD